MLVLVVPVLLDPGSEAMAQACTPELAEADQTYTVGRFDETIKLLNRCLNKHNATSPERQQAYRLVALSYIGKGDSGRARENVQALLRINPGYQPDTDQDLPSFVKMVRDARREVARPQQREEPEAEDGGGVSKLLLIGGGVALAALAAVLLAGGSDEGGGNGVLEPTTINEREPNNEPNQAQVLRGNPPITVHGNVEVNDHSEIGFNHQDGSYDDFEDWYQVTIATPGIRINLSGFSSDCDLFLLQPNPLTIPLGGISGNKGTQPELIDLPTLAAGTYLIAVTIFDPDPQGPASTPYTLVVNGAVSGSNLRLAVEQIQRFGGAEVSGHFRLVAHEGAEAPLTAVLPDPNDIAWTAYHDDGGKLIEYDGTEMFHFRPGRGFWVQSAEPYAVKAATTLAPAALGEAYVAPLEKGWNIIANPSSASIDWATVQAVNGITQGLWRWDGYFAQTDAFEPARRGEAYYFMNATGLEALTIPRRSLARSVRHRSVSVLRLSAYREGRQAAVVRAGFADDAAPGLDGYDQYAPPGYFEAVSLRLVRQISSERRVGLASEFRPWGEAGQRFDLMLKAPAHTPVELRVDGLEAFAGYDVYLIDREKAIAYDLHTQPVLTLTSSQALHRFTLVVGDARFARAARAELAPEALHLSNYPNPFNPRTRISYTVPAAEVTVRLDVYDVAGRLVRVLVNGVQEPGVHQVEWDGADASGVPVASGVYLYRLQTGRHLQVRRMLLMK